MRKLIAIGILIFQAYLIISLSRSVWDLWQKQKEVDKARLRVEEEKEENRRLKNEISFVMSEEFVELQARDKLKFVKPGETVVVIPESVLRAATASASPTPMPPNWEQWMKLFF